MSNDRPDRPLFIGNFEYSAEEREVVRLLEKYGPVDKIDMKQGYAFVYMKYKDDGDEAIRKLDDTEWGYKRRRLKVEWAQKAEAERKRDTRPSRTLFVVNFDTRRTTERDLDNYFSRFGRLVRVQIKKNFAFIQYVDVETASRALDRSNGSQFDGRTLAVEFVQSENNFRGADDRDGGGGGGRGRSRSPPPRDYGRGRGRSRSRSRTPPRRRSPEGYRDRSPPRYERRASPPPRARSRSRSPGDRDRPYERAPSYDR